MWLASSEEGALATPAGLAGTAALLPVLLPTTLCAMRCTQCLAAILFIAIAYAKVHGAHATPCALLAQPLQCQRAQPAAAWRINRRTHAIALL